jgi:dihydrofolate reductase
MGKLIYMLNVSADGFIETRDHRPDFPVPVDDELHRFFNEHERGLQASLYGTRLYRLMSAHWPTAHEDPNASPVEREYARIWQAQPKIVFSHSLDRVEGNCRLVQGDPSDVRGQLARLREEFDGDLGVGGATLAASFIRAGLVDEFQMVVHPVVMAGATPYFPPDVELQLRLLEVHRFESGAVYLRYSPV